MPVEPAMPFSPPRTRPDDFPIFRPFRVDEVMAGMEVSRACLRQEEFHEQVDEIRAASGTDRGWTVGEQARQYGKPDSVPYRVMKRILAAAAGERRPPGTLHPAEVLWQELQGRLFREETFRRMRRGEIRINSPGAVTIVRYRRGGEMAARRGTGKCLELGCEATRTRVHVWGGDRAGVSWSGRKYCENHYQPFNLKRNDKLIEQTFAAAWAALCTVSHVERARAQARADYAVKLSLQLAGRPVDSVWR